MSPRPFRERLGRRLAEARIAARISPRDLAERAGVHPNDVARWERGEVAAPASFVVAAAEELGVTTDWLLGLEEQPRRQSVPAGAIDAALLREAILLTHPDRHPPVRGERATRVTQALNALLDDAS